MPQCTEHSLSYCLLVAKLPTPADSVAVTVGAAPILQLAQTNHIRSRVPTNMYTILELPPAPPPQHKSLCPHKTNSHVATCKVVKGRRRNAARTRSFMRTVQQY